MTANTKKDEISMEMAFIVIALIIMLTVLLAVIIPVIRGYTSPTNTIEKREVGAIA